MKKIIGLFLIFFTCVALSSCSDSKSQNTLTISGIGISGETKMFDFYKANHPETEIIIKDYDEQYGDEALTHLNIDIMKNEAGDILYSSGHIDLDPLIKNNVLENMQSQLSESMNKLIPGVRDSCKTLDGVFFVYPYFNIECYICKEKFISQDDWCQNNIIDTISRYIDSDIALFDEYPDSQMTRIIADTILDDIHNLEFERKKSFYIQLIDTCKQVYKTNNIPQSEQSNGYRFRNEKVVCKREILNGLNSFFLNEKGYFNDSISILGTPKEENILKYRSGCYLSIFSKSDNKQKAADFIKTFLEDDYQMSITYEGMAFPVSEKAFSKMKEISLSGYEFDATGKQIGKKLNKVHLGNEWIDIGYPDKEQINKYADFIYNNHYIHYEDYRLQEIVYEELNNIWYENSSAESIVESLYKKISMFLSESQ